MMSKESAHFTELISQAELNDVMPENEYRAQSNQQMRHLTGSMNHWGEVPSTAVQ